MDTAFIVVARDSSGRSARATVRATPPSTEVPALTLRRPPVVTTAAQALAAVRVTAARPRARAPSQLEPGVGSLETATSGVVEGLAPAGEEGSLAGIATSLAGVVRDDPAGGTFSVLGLAGVESAVRLDGIVGSTAALPRDARVAARMSVTPYDVSRGGFSGGELSITTLAGDEIRRRGARLTLADPLVQAGALPAVAGAAPFREFVASGFASGPIRGARVTYAASAQVMERAGEISTLDDLSPTRASALGVSRPALDTLTRAISALGLDPLLDTRERRIRSASVLARIDFLARDSARTGIVVSGQRTTADPPTATPLATRAVAGTALADGLALRVSHTRHAGEVLHETALGANTAGQRTSSPHHVPLATVTIWADQPREMGRSPLAARTAVIGAATQPFGAVRHGSVDGRHTVRWLLAPPDRRIATLHAGAAVRGEGARRGAGAGVGSFLFRSPTDFAAGDPISYTWRGPRPPGVVVVGATEAFVSGVFQPTRRVVLQSGVRLDASALSLGDPRAGTRADVDAFLRPIRAITARALDLSPRVGAVWRAPTGGPWVSNASVRAGGGRFVSGYRAAELLESAATLRGDWVADVVCVGQSVPSPEWESYVTYAGAAPDCPAADGPAGVGDGVTTRVPALSALAPGYRPPASWRASLGWAGTVRRRVVAGLDFLVSRTDRLASISDVNFDAGVGQPSGDPVPRPLHVERGAVTSDGLVPSPARRLETAGAVALRRSDVSSVSRQVTATARVNAFGAGFLAAAYALTDSREQRRGFDGSTGGNPLAAEWQPSALAARHSVTLRGSLPIGTLARFGAVNLIGRAASGRPFTPLVEGDVNGDGYARNDRAFVLGPPTAAAGAEEAALRQAFTDLSPSLPGRLRRCLARQVGRIAAANSCHGPWEVSLDASVVLDAMRRRRVAVLFDLINLPALADALAHGGARPSGWGNPGRSDPVLLVASGFDPARGAFRYRVNHGFGGRVLGSSSGAPFQLRLDVRVDLAPDVARQRLALNAARARAASEQTMLATYLARIPDPAGAVVSVMDSVGLTRDQHDSLRVIQRVQQRELRAVWEPAVRFARSHPTELDAAAARVRAAERQSSLLYARWTEAIRGVLRPEQRLNLPEPVALLLDPSFARLMSVSR